MLQFSQGRGYLSSLAEQFRYFLGRVVKLPTTKDLLENSADSPKPVCVLFYPHILSGTQCCQDADTLQGYIQ